MVSHDSDSQAWIGPLASERRTGWLRHSGLVRLLLMALLLAACSAPVDDARKLVSFDGEK